ncbi:hypothetical protein PN462_15835 [Spirulina sp. CS-785/01]|uniref:hypothetical protein n=1 Tax=Spirulina sp. CS-785/01 TaxID=3021716 RepID=UPI00232BB66F|nr:hypothetical protein [Spirulina sp. CS-785/01]MDB9314582.1 hypothetical protein [Spirulina sp. CS-785/01]
MDEEQVRDQMDAEMLQISFNRLYELGNQAIQLGLIAGHGFQGGMYEILKDGEALTMSPETAQTYLEELIQNKT